MEPAAENDGTNYQGLMCVNAPCPEFGQGVAVEEVELVDPKKLAEELVEKLG